MAFKVNEEMFGKYVRIPTGYSKEMHIYKVVNSMYSNTYCDVPIVYDSEPVGHEKIETTENPYGLEKILNVIHCGIDETKVIRVAMKDCEIVKPKTNYDRIHNMSMEEMAEFLPMVLDLFCKPTDKCMVFDINHCGECEETKECALKWLQAESDKV